jgi:hypothetical protein
MSWWLEKRQWQCIRRFCAEYRQTLDGRIVDRRKWRSINPDDITDICDLLQRQRHHHKTELQPTTPINIHQHQQKQRIAMLYQISYQLLLSLLVLLAPADGFVPLSGRNGAGRSTSSSTSIYSSDYSRSTGGQQQQGQQQVRAGENAPQFMSQADEARKVCDDDRGSSTGFGPWTRCLSLATMTV